MRRYALDRRWTAPHQSLDPAGFIMRVFMIPLVVVAAATLVAAGIFPAVAGAGRAVKLFSGELDPEGDQGFDLGQFALRSTIHANDDSVLAQVADLNRVEVSLAQVNQNTRDAVLAIEDHKFYEHAGVDVQAIARAFIRNALAGEVVQGGSTLTQQLAKNLITGSEETFKRKWDEAKAALILEQQFSKDQILELYLNYVYFGNGVYGIGTAAEWYFGKRRVENLTIAQAALLAGLIKAPVAYDPIKNPEAALARRNLVIDKMLEFGFIDRAEHGEARSTPVELNEKFRNVNKPGTEPYFVQYVKDTFLHPEDYFNRRDPQYKLFINTFGRTYEERFNALFQGGLRISTTLDPEIQEAAQDSVTTRLPNPGKKPPSTPEAAVITLVPNSGAIRAMYGGPNFQESKFNLATQSGRTAGSAFKAFTLAAAFEQGVPVGKVYNATAPIKIPQDECPNEDGAWSPGNADPSEGGYMDLTTATADSVNVYFAQLIAEIGPDKVAEVAKRMGVRSYARGATVSVPPYCAITLGAVEVNPLSMTSGFSTLANEGRHCHPYAIRRVESATGEVLFKARPYCQDAIEPNIAAQVTSLLEGVVEFGTGSAAALGGRPVAGKTGTGQEYQDAWFVGYVPQLTTGVWVGYSEAEYPMRDLPILGGRNAFGGTIAAPIFHDVMVEGVKGIKVVKFPTPPPARSGEVPDVIGMKKEAAVSTVAAANFTPVVETKDSIEPEGTVFDQDPNGGAVRPLGSIVKIFVSNGKAPKIPVPNVVGLSQDEAISILEEAGFQVSVEEQAVDDPDLVGIVLSQTPGPGQERRGGTTVTIIVGKHEKPPPSPSPSPSK